ncbi:MAG: type secretion system protein GspE, partial [Solirubrobacterales bacterium]|nr:type secretion system protein GspE [Solirubrobacterales bacterium]
MLSTSTLTPTARTGLTPPTQRGFSSRLIGDVAVGLGYVTRDQVDEAVAEAKRTGRLTGRVLLDRRMLSAGQYSRVIAERFGLDHVNLSAFVVDRDAAALVDVDALRRFGAVPVARTGPGTLLVAISEPSNVLAIDDMALLTGMAIISAIATKDEIDALLDSLAGASGSVRRVPDVVEVVQQLVEQTVGRGATDLHLTPEGDGLVARLRVDGVLTAFTTLPAAAGSGVLSRLKVMAELELTDRRNPQEGRAVVVVDGRPLDVRIVTLPLVDGEAAILRILHRPEHVVGLDDLGLEPDERRVVERAGARGHGAILVAGPRDAGKTATLHALLAPHATAERSAHTIEDPVERRVPG